MRIQPSHLYIKPSSFCTIFWMHISHLSCHWYNEKGSAIPVGIKVFFKAEEPSRGKRKKKAPCKRKLEMSYWHISDLPAMPFVCEFCHVSNNLDTKWRNRTNQQTKSKKTPNHVKYLLSSLATEETRREHKIENRRKYVLIVWRADAAALVCGRCRITLMA